MTDLLTTDHADSGEIPRIDGLGTDPTRDLSAHARRDTTGEATQNLGPWSEFSRPPRRPAATGAPIFDVEDTVTYLLPDMAAAQPIAPLERVAGAEDTAVHSILDSLAGARAGLDGELEGPQKPPPPLPKPPKLRRSVPVAAMVDREAPGWRKRAFHKGKRRKPEQRRVSPWVGVAIALGFSFAVWAGVYLAAHAVLGVFR